MSMATIKLGVQTDLTDNVTPGLQKLAAQGTDELKKLTEAQKALNQVAIAGKRYLTDPLIGIGQIAFDASADFETSVTAINKVLDLSAPRLEKMRSQILDLSDDLRVVDPNKIAAVAAAGAQFGTAADDVVRFTQIVGKMAFAFDLPADQVGESSAKMRNIFKLTVEQLSDLGGTVNQLSNNMAARASQIMSVLPRVAGIANQAGLTYRETSALAATVISLGIAPAKAATGINFLIGAMNTATVGSARFKRGVGLIGMSTREMENDIRARGSGAIIDFLEKINALDEATRNRAIALLGGREYADDLGAMAGNVELLRKALNLANDQQATANSLQREFDIQTGTTNAQVQRMQVSLSKLAIVVGDVLLPPVNAILDKLIPVTQNVANFAKENPKLVQGIVYVGAALAAIAPSVLIFQGLTGILSQASTAFAFFGSGAIAPILGVAAAGAIAFYTFKSLSGETKLLSALQNSLGEVAKNTMRVFSALGSVLGTVFGAIGNALGRIFNALGQIAGKPILKVLNFALESLAIILEKIATTVERVSPYIDRLFGVQSKPVTNPAIAPDQFFASRATTSSAPMTFAPTVNIQGNADKNDVLEAIARQQREFEDFVKKTLDKYGRTSYA